MGSFRNLRVNSRADYVNNVFRKFRRTSRKHRLSSTLATDSSPRIRHSRVDSYNPWHHATADLIPYSTLTSLPDSTLLKSTQNVDKSEKSFRNDNFILLFSSISAPFWHEEDPLGSDFGISIKKINMKTSRFEQIWSFQMSKIRIALSKRKKRKRKEKEKMSKIVKIYRTLTRRVKW